MVDKVVKILLGVVKALNIFCGVQDVWLWK